MIRHRDGSLWVVKGCYHLDDGVVALPRLINGFKVKNYIRSLDLISRYFPHYLRFVYELGRVVPLVPPYDIADVLSPIEATRKLLRSYGDKPLVKVAYDLLQMLRSGCGCDAGFSGSLAGGYFTEGSDIDIVVYSNTAKCYELLLKLREEGFIRPMDPQTSEYEFLMVSEGGDKTILKPMQRRVLQGVFRGFRYTIRLVNCGNAITLRDYIVVPNTSMIIIITESSNSYTTPATYNCIAIKSASHYAVGRPLKVLTHRIRYSELGVNTILRLQGPYYLLNDFTLVNLDLPEVTVELINTP